MVGYRLGLGKDVHGGAPSTILFERVGAPKEASDFSIRDYTRLINPGDFVDKTEIFNHRFRESG